MSNYESGIGRALKESNDKLESRLMAMGFIKKPKRGKKTVGDVFVFDPTELKKLARIGTTLAGDHARVSWVPMSVINERAKANRPAAAPMPEEVKMHLRAIGKLKPHDNGDPAARRLRDCVNQDEVYAFTADYCKLKESELRTKYANLNPGQQKMCCANRVRAQWKKLHPDQIVKQETKKNKRK